MSATADSDTSSRSNMDVPEDEDNASTDSDDFIQHYESSSADVASILNEITGDLVHFKPVHRWEEKLFVPPIKQFSVAVRKHVSKKLSNLDFLLNYSSVEEIENRKDENEVSRAMAHPGDIRHHLFFQRVCSSILER
jgi:hypothetical protein